MQVQLPTKIKQATCARDYHS